MKVCIENVTKLMRIAKKGKIAAHSGVINTLFFLPFLAVTV